LAPDGELYLEQVCVHEMLPSPPLTLFLELSSQGDSICRIEVRGTGIFIGYQYIAELYQYFYSGTVGLGLWMLKSAEVLSKVAGVNRHLP
jgi:hypothetical protein